MDGLNISGFKTLNRRGASTIYDLERWKQDFYNSQKAPGRPKLDPELVDLRNKEKELSKDLKRKERALAEMTARVVLLKKSRLIWGDGEDEE